MKEEALFEAIGNVEDRFLEELEESTHRRLPKHFGLVAALIALLLTACAAPVVVRNLSALKTGAIVASEEDLCMEVLLLDSDGETVMISGPSTVYMSGTVSLEVEPAEDLPESIDTYYLPLKLLEHCQVEHWTVSDTLLSVELSMDATSAVRDARFNGHVYRQPLRAYGLVYQQQLLPEGGTVVSEGVLGIGIWDQQEVTYGDVSAVEFGGKWTADMMDLDTGERIQDRINVNIRHVFWSDGTYLYGLRLVGVPPLVSSVTVQEILDSLTAIEDLSQYLPDPQ